MGIFDGGGGGGFDVGGGLGNLISGGTGSGGLDTAIGLGAGFGGAELSASFAQQSAKSVRRFAKNQRASAYQTAVLDLQAAGLNPILAAGGSPLQGGPGGQAQTPDYARALQAGGTTGVAVARNRAELKNITQDTARKKQETFFTSEAAWEKHKINQLLNLSLEEKQLGMSSARTIGNFDRTWLGKKARQADRLLQPIQKMVPGLGVMVGPGGAAKALKPSNKPQPRR